MIPALCAALALGACGDGAGPSAPPLPPAQPEPAVLHVAYISLLPRIEPPDSGSTDPAAGWPAAGQAVEWVGHVVNSGDLAAAEVGYRWSVDGQVAAEGTVAVPGGEESTVSLHRPWSGVREMIALELTAGVEPGEGDRRLEVASDGLSVGLWADSALYERMVRDPDLVPWAVWAGREVWEWNRTLASYGSPIPPERILDRLRLDRVEVLPAGSSWPADITTDLAWYYSPNQHDTRFLTSGSAAEVFADQTIVLHELLHQRGITDLYAYHVWQGLNGSEVAIVEPSGGLAVGGPRMPYLWEWSDGGVLFDTPYPGRLMSDNYSRPTRVDPHTAYGLNQVQGRRTPRWIDRFGNARNGFAAGSPNGNGYLLHVPDSVRLRVTVGGAPAPAGADVELFFDYGFLTYMNYFGPDPDVTASVEADGTATVPVATLRTPLGEAGVADSDVVVIRVAFGGRWGYAYLPVYELNMAYARGDRIVAELTVDVELS